MKRNKKFLCAAGLYICAVIFLWSGFWCLRMFGRFGSEPWRQPSYVGSELFGNPMKREIQALENLLAQYQSAPEEKKKEFEEMIKNYWPANQYNLRFSLVLEYENGDRLELANSEARADYAGEAEADMGKPVFYRCVLNEAPETNIPALENAWFHVNQKGMSQVTATVWFNGFEIMDWYGNEKKVYDTCAYWGWTMIAACLSAAAGACILLIFMIRRGAGRSTGMPDRLYPEEQLALLGILAYGLYPAYSSGNSRNLGLYICAGLIPAGFLLFSLIREHKKDSCLITGLLNYGKALRTEGIVFLAACLVAAVICFTTAGMMMDSLWWVWLLYGGAVFMELRRLSMKLDQEHLLRSVEEISSGRPYIPVDFKNPKYKRCGKYLELMSEGIQHSVEESMKAERLKVDLITNVSHDLKTPLTSVITYIRLLEKEGGLAGKGREYLQILSDKAQQLKGLVEDLLDAARITSGNEKAEPEQLDFAEMVMQANGEFAQAMEEKQLELVVSLEQENLPAWIDGQKTWRILSNLYGNVCKYSLPGTRVYAEAGEHEGQVWFQLKNVSKAPLNIPPERLMERFVQGDVSRSTGGNGLGLAISRDLAALQGGSLELEIYGDLFLVKLTLPGYQSDVPAHEKEVKN